MMVATKIEKTDDIETIDDANVRDSDVLSGRQTPRKTLRGHTGTKEYERLIKLYSKGHDQKTRKEKTATTNKLVNEILDRGGRFLSWNPSSSQPISVDNVPVQAWRVICLKKAREKVAAAIKNQVKISKRRQQVTKARQRSPSDRIPQFEHVFAIQQNALKNPNYRPQNVRRSPDFDIYTGRGTNPKTARHLGNRLFVALVKANGRAYKATKDNNEKKFIVCSIFYAIKYGMGGQFRVWKKDESRWREQDKIATIKKISQACRDALKNRRG